MDPQTLATAVLIVPAIVLGIIGWRASRAGRTSLGVGLRDGAAGEFGRGVLYSLPFLLLLVLAFGTTGLSQTGGPTGGAAAVAVSVGGIWVYFLVLFAVEELVFRGLFMTGLGVLAGQVVALVVTAVLVAAPYALTAHTGVLPLLGALVTNLFHGWARWRSGRIWWGLGQRWVWNSGVVSLGFADSAFHLEHPLLVQHLTGPAVLTGGDFGVEGGLVGILFLLVMAAGSVRFARGRRPWGIDPSTAVVEGSRTTEGLPTSRREENGQGERATGSRR